ncbi:MAG TPA: hypothetical protein VMS17_05275 [Gemmataceae bacterium]|nr:hypothetical protein [Gemmataceae bacterium]
MKDNNLDIFALRSRAGQPRSSSPLDRATAADADADEEECQAFGYLRGIRDTALSLEFRFANGNRQAFPYSWLGPATYNPSAGLLLKFVGDLVYLVLLEGSNLNALVNGAVSLYDRGIQRHRITWVKEMTRQQAQQTADGEVTIERIRILSHRPDEEPKGVEWLQSFNERR